MAPNTKMAPYNKKPKRPLPDTLEDDIEATGIPDNAVPKSKKAKTEASSSLFVRSLPSDATNESLAAFFSEHFPVKHAAVVLDPATKASRGFGFVTLTDAEDALEAKTKLNNEVWNGRRLVVDIAEARHRDKNGPAKPEPVARGKSSKQQAIEEAWVSPKLIIRNLPWSIKTSAQLAALFQPYGKIKFSDLPQDRGKLRGFGFITIRGQKNAENAIAAVNGKLVDGRELAVDWAVTKDEWQQQHGGPDEKDTEVKAAPKPPKTADKAAKEGDRKSKDTKKKDAPKPAADDEDAQLKADLENFLQNHMTNLEEESDKSDEDKDDEEDEEDDEDEDELEESDEEEEEEPVTRPAKTTDNNKTTVFVRNLPFSATDETLKSHFQTFGPVRYARVVMDKASARPAGTGFVCFMNEADSKACVKAAPRPQPTALANKKSILQDDTADPEGKYTLEGRLLQVAQAVSKDDASRLAADGGANRRANDKRKLFLLEEGQLDTRSPIYQALSQAEIKMRDQSRQQRKKLVEGNPTLHMSLTRLAIRGIPRQLTSKDLKQLAREACVGFAKDVKEGLRQPLSKEEKARANKEAKEAEHNRKLKGKGIVRQAKIEFEARDGGKVAESTGGKSRGYGFIEYSSHRWALMGLRWLNGHLMENEDGRKQRLIAEFAIENAQVVSRRKAIESKQASGEAHKTEEVDDVEEQTEAKPLSKKASKSKLVSKKSAKKFALKTGPKGEAGSASKPGAAAKSSEAPTKEKDLKKKGGPKTREDIQQSLIARKRLVRKKKARARA
ncbi:nucleolar protein [Plectosphaerella cucumerina]|uniref:Nucleolar protein n=1 Tax=Plectosphaerella cucumerina TaxID=40658 RepID=A0A8K0T9Z9_9PEZI|nr:nucleolar protein [Plectosphaerella cucumerina]